MAKEKNKSEKESWASLFAPRTIVATAALIVSICSLVLTISQMRANREAQHLSVLPYVICGINNGNLSGNGTASYEMIIQNNGIGPAFLHSVRIKSRDKYFEASQFAEAVQYFTEADSLPTFLFSSVSKMELIPAGGRILWFSPHDPKSAYPFLKKLWSGDKGFIVYICYGDVYGRTWTVDSYNDQIVPCAACPVL
jgi:hypothetical protein